MPRGIREGDDRSPHSRSATRFQRCQSAVKPVSPGTEHNQSGELAKNSPAPQSAQSAAAVLGELEMAAAATPWDARIWNAALTELRQGRVTDNDVGASATMGGARPVAVAVVTAYCREDVAVLRRCHQSVLAQTYPCRHIMVADGFPRQEIDTWNVEHVRLERAYADTGDTPRAMG